MNDPLIFKLYKVILTQAHREIVCYLPLELIENDQFLRPLVNCNIEITICGRFDFVPCDHVSDSSLDKPIE